MMNRPYSTSHHHLLRNKFMFNLFIIYSSIIILIIRTVNAHYCQSCAPTLPGVLNVHVVCHTHMDTGWVHTFDQYYHRYIPIIYNSVIESLAQHPRRKFIVVETSFFSRWYHNQPRTVQLVVHELVNSGQLEFISGGWSMNDEATAHYSSIIDNLSLGVKWLEKTFGQCGLTKTGWQIDPFGHSREQASLFSQMGFDSLFLGRVDHQDKNLRERMRTLEFIWKSSPSIGEKCDIFTGILPNVYWPPKGFCYDINCFDETLNQQNIMRKAREFIQTVRNQAKQYATNHTIITMGMDFYYQASEKWYSNLDYLFDAVNSLTATEKVHIIYSTPSCYARALNQLKRRWPIKLDDFYPYADAPDAYWTGYFTSRPSLKYAIKKGANLLQASNQLNVLAMRGLDHANQLQELKEVMGILQHHDAITGTCKQYVNDDYQRMLSQASDKAEQSFISAYMTLVQAKTAPGQSIIGFCRDMNISQCHYTEFIEDHLSSIMSIYNPIAHSLRHFVRIPVKNMQYKVVDHNEHVIPSQLVPIHPKILSLKERNSLATHELVFMSTLDPLGISSYLITKMSDYGSSEISENMLTNGQDVFLHNGKIGILIDGHTGFIKQIQLPNGENIPFVQSFWYYKATSRYSGDKPSGAYVFKPAHKNPYIVNTKSTYKIYRGSLVDEIHQVFTDWCTQVIRLYKNYNYIEFDWVVGPIPIGKFPDETGLEIVTKYETNFQNKQTFFTDSNGRETIRRIRHHRPTWDLQTGEEVSSNYYPVTSWTFIRDLSKNIQMTILTDRPQGTTSMVDGVIEMMLHRRLLFDDGYGMEEALNEPGHNSEGLIVRGKHRLIVDKIQESVRFMRKLSKTTSWIPLYLFRNVPAMYGPNLIVGLNTNGIREKLPVNIHLLSLEQWDEQNIVIRLEHFYEINEDIKYSQETMVRLSELFTNFIIVDVLEMNLLGTETLEQSERNKMKWMAELDPYENYTMVLSSSFTRDSQTIRRDSSGSFSILFKPMQIRTFLIRIRPRIY
ncbi:LOW QUALITY PROTEIN: lysosomal alpha-mannosidase-like [Dermatophagoides farinae]|uniref:LOW QUALITY PROTEIN: lysosomal alpha-mannosidase-like n=1 Tax=Dermatophagoides farinae TaxID=6954 RepID=UPI003F6186B2